MRVQVRQWGYETFAVYVDGEFCGTEQTRHDAQKLGESRCDTTVPEKVSNRCSWENG